MTRDHFWAGLVLLLALVLTGCKPKSDAVEPPEIRYGQDLCDACGMVLDEPQFAAVTVLDSGESRKFDDIGDMIVYHMDHPDQQVQAWFVHDYDSQEWIRAEDAFYVVSMQIKSPMGHGIAAFGAREAAERYAATLPDAKVFNFDEVRADVHVKVHG